MGARCTNREPAAVGVSSRRGTRDERLVLSLPSEPALVRLAVPVATNAAAKLSCVLHSVCAVSVSLELEGPAVMCRLLMCCLWLAACLMMTSASPAADDSGPLVFISEFAAGDGGGVRVCRLDPEAGQLQPVRRVGGMEHPFFLALSPNRQFLYAIHAPGKFGGEQAEFVSAYRVDGQSGELQLINRASARGTAACYLDVDPSGKSVLVANYMSGSVAALPVHDDGALGEPTAFVQHTGSSVRADRQAAAHAHCIVVSPDGRYALAADLGLDQVLVYRLDGAAATLQPARPAFVRTPPGAGPRHLTFHPDGQRVYVINELSNSVTLFDYDSEDGALAERQTISTVPADFQGTSYCADVKLTPNGRFLYGTNRGHDSLAVYRVADDGSLTLVEIVPSHGQGPQNLAITSDGRWLLCANMPGNNVAVFRIDPQSGRLQLQGQPLETRSPSCIRLY